MNLFHVSFTYDGQILRGTSALDKEAGHKWTATLPVDRWSDPAADGDICDLLDLVVEQLANFSDNLSTNARRLRRRREQGTLF
jgi:hypothetical protein